MTSVPLRDLVNVHGRFHRSVQLARDWGDKNSLGGYILTKTAAEIASQIVTAIKTPGGERAWSITGPYGTGKSAFALFLTDLLTHTNPVHAEGKALRRDLQFRARPFVPVLVTGQRSPVVPVLLSALAQSIHAMDSGLSRRIGSKVKAGDATDGDVISFVEEATRAVRDGSHGGVLIVLDEFGKFLEFLGAHPDSTDLQIMQQLAEVAARSDFPIVLISILHTSFAAYLHSANQIQKTEWQKVQGRFVDIAFQEPPEQLLKLIGAAIELNIPTELEAAYTKAVGEITGSPSLEEARQRISLGNLLPACVPLHPITSLLLWPVFRSKLAQNERSLFAFLTGEEPFGFQQFLGLSTWNGQGAPFFPVDRLYDYITTALGQAIYLGDRAHRWAAIEYALERIPVESPGLARAVVKALGLISMYGASVGLRPSREILTLALGNPEDVSQALEFLERLSVIVYRRYQDAYGLWEGSDVDLDSQFEEAAHHISQASLAARLKEAVTLRPLVAKAHYIRTGTLRYFRVDIVDGTADAIQKALDAPIAPADGQVIFVLGPTGSDRQELLALARRISRAESPERRLRIIAFPDPIAGLEEVLEEVERWKWVRDNVQALQGDPVARQEVRVRLSHNQSQLENIAGRVLCLQGYPFDPSASHWIHDGRMHRPTSTRDFQQWLSLICNQVFAQAPHLQNELLNRDHLSSAATRARRNLLEAMITSEGQPQLGFEGTPPEVSMYRAFLENGGFHRVRDGQWRIVRPGEQWQPAWRTIQRFLETTRHSRRPVAELFSTLRQPPFGFREGPLPILLLAVLVTRREDVALYEDGIFVPELRIEVVERLVRVPEKFEIQQYSFSHEEREVFTSIGEIIRTLDLPRDSEATSQLLQIVKPLVVFVARLPPYSKHTRRIERAEAIAVRDALLRTSDPHALVFKELPLALGLTSAKAKWTETAIEQLRNSLIALQRAYPRLLDQIEAQLRTVFGLKGTGEEAQQQLQQRAAPLDGHAADRVLTIFVKEASRLDNQTWRERLARVVNDGIPSNQWHDADLVGFQVRLRQIASDFVRLEELVAEQKRTGASQIIRIGLLDGKVQEAREVISITPDRAVQVAALVERLASALGEDKDQNEESRHILLAALAQVANRYLKQNGKERDGSETD